MLKKTLLSSVIISAAFIASAQETPTEWFSSGQTTVINNFNKTTKNSKAKNVILFVGDGMSIATVTAARILQGQLNGQPGEENQLAFDTLSNMALSKTYNTDAQTPDSAGTMTAMMTGYKARSGVISVNSDVLRGDCASSQGNEVKTFLEQAEEIGKSTGVISTARITHATPAATYAHVPDRNWEADSHVPAEEAALGCKDIASQLIDFTYGDGVDVVMGGGRSMFLPNTVNDPESSSRTGDRSDGRNLTEEWQNKGDNYYYIWNQADFNSLPTQANTKVLGLFNRSHMEYEADRADDSAGEPSLSEMTKKSIDILSQNQNGYFLMVEAGRIDHGHHAGNAYRALTDTVELSNAVQTALDKVNLDDTLIIVTADHGHTLTISGYSTRGNPILGKAKGADGTLAKDSLGLPYTTLGYTNGPGYAGASDEQDEGIKTFPHGGQGFTGITLGRPDLTDTNTENKDYMQEATVPMGSETHTGTDVAIFSDGPMSYLLNGVVEQNVIYHAMNTAFAPNIVNNDALTGLSGLWFNRDKPGVGFNIITSSSGLVVYYYGYDNTGKATWLVSEPYPNAISKNTSFTIPTVYQNTESGDANWSTAPSGGINGTQKWGTMTLTFNSCNRGSITLTGTDEEVIIPITKLANNTGEQCVE